MRPKTMALLTVFTLSLAVGAASATAAGATPVWKFDGHELVGEETVAGVGGPVVLTVPGAPVTCADVALGFEISNSAGHALGEMTEVPFYECTTTAKGCTVQSIAAERLPWSMHVSPGPIGPTPKYYLVFEGVRISIEFRGELCALSGSPVRLKGSIGGQFSSSTVTFDKASYEATGTGLKVGTEKAELTGTFPVEAFGSHHGETLELS